jgi:hypothetical protein
MHGQLADTKSNKSSHGQCCPRNKAADDPVRHPQVFIFIKMSVNTLAPEKLTTPSFA